MTTNQENKYQHKILTVPNLLSVFRLCLIPVIVWLYTRKGDYAMTLLVLILSGLTDVVDGIIARRFHMISDFGKALDPVADKLTQMATLYCLVSRFSYMRIPLIILIVKEVCTSIAALISIKRTDKVEGAVWHGKLTTVALYAMMAAHLIWYQVPEAMSLLMVGICIFLMLMSFAQYMVRYVKAIRYKTFGGADAEK